MHRRDGEPVAHLLERTNRNPEIEEVFGALSMLLNGGGLEQIQQITRELNLALGELPNYSAFPGQDLGPQHKGTTHICQSLDALEREVHGRLP